MTEEVCMATKVFSQRVDLPDDRKVHVLAYDDGSVRFRLTGGAPYALVEAFLTGREPTIIKLVPRPTEGGAAEAVST